MINDEAVDKMKSLPYTVEVVKRLIKIKIDGNLLKRDFRNQGEAIKYLEKQGMNRSQISKKVKFILT